MEESFFLELDDPPLIEFEEGLLAWESFLEGFFLSEPLEDPLLVEFEEGLSVPVLRGFFGVGFFLLSSSISDGARSGENSTVTSALGVGTLSGVPRSLDICVNPQETPLFSLEDPESGVLRLVVVATGVGGKVVL